MLCLTVGQQRFTLGISTWTGADCEIPNGAEFSF